MGFVVNICMLFSLTSQLMAYLLRFTWPFTAQILVKATMIYTHVVERGALVTRSPLDL